MLSISGKIKAILFDMDGLLLDTEKIALLTFQEACRRNHFEPDLTVYNRCIGTTYNNTREILLKGYGRDFPIDEVYKDWGKIFQTETTEKPLPLKTGVLSLLNFLDRIGLRKGVVTSTRSEIALRNLTKANILPFFEFVVGGDQILNGKPHPEIYLTGCQKFNEKPGDCLALEDSDIGVLSAHNAGLQIIQVPDILEPSESTRALGHKIVKSLSEVEAILRQSLTNI
jgi:HAD superfamily hydrolase (TIGR01509 family)